MAEIDIVRLSDAVKASGYKQNYIAEKCRINNRSFSRILKGQQSLSANVYAEICTVIGAPMEVFVNRKK